MREEKRLALLEEKRRRAAGEGSSEEGSSYYTDSEEDVAPRRDGKTIGNAPVLALFMKRSAQTLCSAKDVFSSSISQSSYAVPCSALTSS